MDFPGCSYNAPSGMSLCEDHDMIAGVATGGSGQKLDRDYTLDDCIAQCKVGQL